MYGCDLIINHAAVNNMLTLMDASVPLVSGGRVANCQVMMFVPSSTPPLCTTDDTSSYVICDTIRTDENNQ